MKLFRKIYIQVLLGMIALLVLLTGYLLWETQNRTLEDAVKSEVESIGTSVLDFRNRVLKEDSAQAADTVRRAVAVWAFHAIYEIRGALFEDGEELFNASPYEFDWEELKGLKQEEFRKSSEIYASPVQNLDGRKLIIFYTPQTLRGKNYELVIYRDVTEIYQRTRSLMMRSCGFAAVLLLLLGALLYQGIYRAIRPMIELQRAAASIAAGDYGSRVPVRGRDEIREVTVSFNRMAEKVEEHLAALTAVNEQQRQLLGSLAHELKTPMTAIIGYADTLLTVRLSQERRERALSYIRGEGQRLARLSEKMLELTGLYDTGGEGIEPREVRVGELLRKLTDLTAFRLEEKGLRMEKSCCPGDLVRRLDEDLMLSLLMNLVDNACKASRPGGLIRVEADRERFVVEDFGKGIPPKEIERVTEAFYMVDKSRAKSAGSVGLGLALCQRIAELHGGRLEIESEVGRGTRITVWLQLGEDLIQGESVK